MKKFKDTLDVSTTLRESGVSEELIESTIDFVQTSVDYGHAKGFGTGIITGAGALFGLTFLISFLEVLSKPKVV